MDLQSEAVFDGEVPRFYGDDEISLVVKDLLDPAIGSGRSKALQRYMCIGKQLYQEACQLDEKIGTFEISISRSYFHVKALDASQLENWHRYLDFVEMQGDFDWVYIYFLFFFLFCKWILIGYGFILFFCIYGLGGMTFFYQCLNPFPSLSAGSETL